MRQRHYRENQKNPGFKIALAAFRLSAWALSAALLWQGAARAQVFITPMVIEVPENRGQAQGFIEVRNNSNDTFRARIYTESFTYNRDAGFQSLKSTNASDLSSYLQFSPREMILQPGANRRVRFVARLAPNLPDGEYRTMIFTEKLQEAPAVTTASNRPNVALTARIGVAVFVRKGNVAPNLAVGGASLNADKNRVQLLVGNTGKASARPGGTWTLKQGGTVVKTGEIPPTIVLAENERNCLVTYLGAEQDRLNLAPGEYQLTGELTWGEDNNKSKLPFSVNLTVPGKTAVSPSS